MAELRSGQDEHLANLVEKGESGAFQLGFRCLWVLIIIRYSNGRILRENGDGVV